MHFEMYVADQAVYPRTSWGCDDAALLHKKRGAGDIRKRSAHVDQPRPMPSTTNQRGFRGGDAVGTTPIAGAVDARPVATVIGLPIILSLGRRDFPTHH